VATERLIKKFSEGNGYDQAKNIQYKYRALGKPIMLMGNKKY